MYKNVVLLSLCEQEGPEHTAKAGFGIKSVQIVWVVLVNKSSVKMESVVPKPRGLS